MNITCFDHPSYIVEKQYKKTQPTLADSPVVFTNHSRKEQHDIDLHMKQGHALHIY